MEESPSREIRGIFEKYQIDENIIKYYHKVAQEDRQRYHKEMNLYDTG